MDMIAKWLSRAALAATAVSAGLVAVPAHAAFTFDANNQGWRLAGLYDDGDLTPIAGFFGDDPAGWFNAGGAHGGVLLLGSGGFTFPDSPSGSNFLHWDLNSPDLSGNAEWQGIDSFTYDVTGENIAITGDSSVQGVVKVRNPDNTVSYYTDGVFHPLLGTVGGNPTPWTTFSVDVGGLGLPAGSTLLGLNIRFFFEAGSPNSHDGYFFLDNVTPVAGGGGTVPEPASLLLVGMGIALVATLRRRRPASESIDHERHAGWVG
jgi:hypothetical protein